MHKLLAIAAWNSRKIRRCGQGSPEQTQGPGWGPVMNWVISKTEPGKKGKRSSIRKVERRKPKGISGDQLTLINLGACFLCRDIWKEIACFGARREI